MSRQNYDEPKRQNALSALAERGGKVPTPLLAPSEGARRGVGRRERMK